MYKDDTVWILWPPGILRQLLFMVGLRQVQEPYNTLLLFPPENDDIMVKERGFP